LEFEGRGLHSGIPTKVRLMPGDSGIIFRNESGAWNAIPENVTSTTRCTCLGDISTVEHLMSALAAHEISDVTVEVAGTEIPGMDGSAAEFWQRLEQSTFVELGQSELPTLFRRLFLTEDGGKIAIGHGDGHWRYEYHGDNRWPEFQSYEHRDLPENYGTDIAPARTVAFADQIPNLIAAGLGLGLSQGDVLLLGNDGYENAPRFQDELARHKLLDLIGDIALSRVPIRFLSVVAERTGHRHNIRAAYLLKQALQNQN
jgi:UDP-3-O-acyl-N-acetylglucosamine deacetylase